jgi:hypothetical protein
MCSKLGVGSMPRRHIPARPDASLKFLKRIRAIPFVPVRKEFVSHPKEFTEYRRKILVFELILHQWKGILQYFKRFSKGFLLVYRSVVE